MNFLFILNTFYPNIGGVESATLGICKELIKGSHNIYILTTNKTNFYPNKKKLALYENFDGIHIHRVRNALRVFLFPLKTLYLAKKYQIDYVIITDFLGFGALFLKRIYQIPFVYLLNGYNPICPTGILHHQQICQGFELIKCFKYCRKLSIRFIFSLIITRRLISRAKSVMAVSQAVKNAFLVYFGEMPVKLNYYGMDLQKFQPFSIKASNLNYNLTGSDGIILFFGRLIKQRGILEFLPHFKQLIQKKNYKLLIVGLGPESMEIKTAISELKIENNVLFVGPLRNQKLIDVINLVDLVILPILFPEPLGLVVLESMACAKPVISFSLGGVKELITNMKTGILVPPNDWAQFIQKIEELLENKDLRSSLGQAARQKVERDHNWNQFMKYFLKELEIE